MPEDFMGIIGAILIFVIFIPAILALSSMITSTQCSDYQQKINQLQLEVSRLSSNIMEMNSTAEFYKAQYFNLTNTAVTKKDFVELKSDINSILLQLNNTRNEVYNVNEQIINIQNIKNTYFVFAFVVSLNLALIGLTIIDFTIFKMKYSKKIIEKIYSYRVRIKNENNS